MNELLWSGIRKIYKALIPLVLNGLYDIVVLVLLIKILTEVSK